MFGYEEELMRRIEHLTQQVELEKIHHAETRIELSKAKDRISELEKDNKDLIEELDNIEIDAEFWKNKYINVKYEPLQT
jgi:chromosome segregation ATPase